MQIVLTVNVPGISGQNGALLPQRQIADRIRRAADWVQFQSQGYIPLTYTSTDQVGNTMYGWVITAT
jgi:hypothetical protein